MYYLFPDITSIQGRAGTLLASRQGAISSFNWRLFALCLWGLLVATTLAFRYQSSRDPGARAALLTKGRQFLQAFVNSGEEEIDARIQSYIDLAVHRALRDAVGRRDFALYANGGWPIPDITSEMSPRPKTPSSHPPELALKEDMHVGSCWQLPARRGQLGLRLSHMMYPTHVSVDHIPQEIAADVGEAPRLLHVWGAVDGDANQGLLRHTTDSLIASGREPPLLVGPAITCGLHFALLASAHYDIHGLTHVQTFDVQQWVIESGIDFGVVVFEVVDNWGANSTCLYRVRVHGAQTGPASRQLV
ncbi:uncharacterized protein TRAVEDRAFT_126646 [Trametes versicolor FP-101664 SS1]|uniref:uncharacterized protein n=1 Tax=Trametes versicolor (strain FP-101664) TaxID=717944 RepID=UPI000462457A|nr:uncharacterized protein TRAVEDRAFT_126646 [Trametes versicolor FP-101664 SS1]EIW57907.1 hypothetical protein TRAVEDRAFT_126646 [Trametes versicolor FP-101664 SS1]